MKLVVLMSTFNGEKYLEQQIESILNQKCSLHVDLIVRDDGSTDSTVSILEKFSSEGKLKWYKGDNLKPAKSFLDLVKHCSGYDFYAFADQDDYWYPDKLQLAVDSLAPYSVPALSCGNARLVNQDLVPLGRNVYRKPPHMDFYSVTCGANVVGCTTVFNAKLAELIQKAPMPQMPLMHDHYMGTICTLHDGIIIYHHQVCMDYRQHGKNAVGTMWRKTDAIKDRIHKAFTRPNETLDGMAASICEIYPDVPDADKLKWLNKVSTYRDSVFKAFFLALDRKPKYNSLNMAITYRLATLLRNR